MKEFEILDRRIPQVCSEPARDRRSPSSARGVSHGCRALGVAVAVLLAAGEGSAASPSSQAEGRVVAEIDAEVITADTLDQALGHRAYRSTQHRHQLQRQKLDELINDKLLQLEAARRGISVQHLKETELKAKVQVTNQEVEAFYRERKDSVPAPEPVAKEAFKRYLEQQREAELTKQLVESLRARARVRVHLEAPVPVAVEYLVVPGASFKGPRDAPVTIVEFSDFQCPFCAKAQAVLEQVLETYPNQIKLVYRHFPLERNPQAKLAAEAAECAAQQGKFWEYHDQVFANAPELSSPKLRALGEALHLDIQAFSSCLDGGKARARVAEDLADGRGARVAGTPTFFINGRMVEGAAPLATFKQIIDLQLAVRASQGGAQR